MNEADQRELQEYRTRLRINKHRLDDELEVQAETQEHLADKAAGFDARAIELKDELAKVEARLTEDFREAEKSTKDTVEAKVRRHRDRVQAWERYQGALLDAARWSNLLDAWKGKGKDLQALGRLFGDQYFALSSVTVAPRRDRARRDYTRESGDTIVRVVPRVPMD